METLPADLKKITVEYVKDIQFKHLKMKDPDYYHKYSITNLKRQFLFIKMIRDDEKRGQGYDTQIANALFTPVSGYISYFEVEDDVFNEILYVNTDRTQRLFEIVIRYSERFPNMNPVVERKIDDILKILRVPPKDLPPNYDYNYMRNSD